MFEVTCGSNDYANSDIIIFSQKDYYEDTSGVAAFASSSIVSLTIDVDGESCQDEDSNAYTLDTTNIAWTCTLDSDGTTTYSFDDSNVLFSFTNMSNFLSRRLIFFDTFNGVCFTKESDGAGGFDINSH